MAKFIDERPDETQLEEGEVQGEFEESQETLETSQPNQESEDDLPEKYRGKDIKDIVRMHQEAERAMGRQSSEVGELRRIVDDFVQTQLATQQQAHDSADVEDIDYYADPQKAIDYAISNHPKIKEAETISQQMRQKEALAKLQSAHPDFVDVVKNQDFLDWVTKSKVRTELLRRADRTYDFDSADELLNLWKERQSIVKDTATLETQARKDSVKKASTGNTKGSAEAPSRKIYRRADIIKLMQTDPDRYMSLAQEIRQAYEEGRVR